MICYHKHHADTGGGIFSKIEKVKRGQKVLTLCQGNGRQSRWGNPSAGRRVSVEIHGKLRSRLGQERSGVAVANTDMKVPPVVEPASGLAQKSFPSVLLWGVTAETFKAAKPKEA